MVKVLSNPTRKDLIAAFIEAQAAANKGGRTRRIADDTDVRVARVNSRPCGACEVNGGGVANSYGYRAESSVLAYAWFTDANGIKHVRIAAERVRVSGRHVTSLHLGNRSQQARLHEADAEACLVFQDLFELWNNDNEEFEATAGFSRKLKNNVQDRLTWGALADWCDEHDRAATAARIRAAFPLAVEGGAV